jgi:hypothetical protein
MGAKALHEKQKGADPFNVVGDRSETIVQRKLQEMSGSSARVKQLRAFQEMAIQRKVVKIGTEKVDVDSKDGFITKKGKAEQKEAEEILAMIKDTYGVDISSATLIEGVKDQYSGVPKKVTDALQTREWRMIELRAAAGALQHFAPILGAARASSTRKGEAQEVTAFGKVKNAIDEDTPAGKLDKTTLGEYFEGKKVMGIFKSSEGFKADFSDEKDQLVGTFVHETAHGLLSYALGDFVAASDGFWTDEDTASGKDGAEAPPTDYGETNAGEDMCESAMLYFVDPSRLKSKAPKRYAFMAEIGKSWLPLVKDAPQVTEQEVTQ